MLSPAEALQRVLETAAELPPRAVRLAAACGLYLAEAVAADRDYPAFPRAMMDGFAVRAADAGRTVTIIGEAAAGGPQPPTLAPGTCVEIMTGASCPAGADAVVPKEEAKRAGDTVRLPDRVRSGQSIAARGSECAAGKVVLPAGTRITPLAVAVLASFGRTEVRVIPRPRIGVMTTGAELAAPGEALALGQIRNSNGPMLTAMAAELGLACAAPLHAGDAAEEIGEKLDALADCQIVVVSGGVSAGNYDFVPQALADHGAEVVFHKVSQRPGKPLLFARTQRQLFFGLPGNPLSCHLCFHRYVAAAVRKMAGAAQAGHYAGRLVAAVTQRGPRTWFLTGQAERSERGDEWTIRPLAGVTSADIFSSCSANCYVELPPGEREAAAETEVEFTRMGEAL